VLSAAIEKMRRGAPCVMRQGFKASDSVDANDGLARRERPARYRTESGSAMDLLQFAQGFRAFFQPRKGFVDRRRSWRGCDAAERSWRFASRDRGSAVGNGGQDRNLTGS
jgi:hypothetical protein